jgi:DNA-binding NarL/FixJ family response regulator
VNRNICSAFSSLEFEPALLLGGVMEMNRPRILLAGIPVSLLAAYDKLLCEEFEIVGTSAGGRALMATAIQLQPSVIVLDLAASTLTDAGTRLELKKLIPQTKFLVIARRENLGVALETLREWASGVLLRRSAKKELVGALRELMAGRSYIPRPLNRGTRQSVTSSANHERALTRRQREVLRLMAEGRTMKEIAEMLHLSLSTVAFHKYNIKRTFGLRSNVEMLRLAIREHLVSAE